MQIAQTEAESVDFQVSKAFSRTRGWVTAGELDILRGKRVAIAGMGGVGGHHLLTLTRLGVGQFNISDFDRFEMVNFNRQLGAGMSTLGRRKMDVLAEMALDINPELQIKGFPDGIDEDNVSEFLEGADLYLDGLDFFAMAARRTVMAACAKRNIPAVTVAPLGMGGALLNFLPGGMTFEEYFQLDGHPVEEQLLRFLVGLAPTVMHRGYLVDPSAVDFARHRGPSTPMACDLCAGIAATEALKILLGRGNVRGAPHGMQFDAYLGKTAHTWRPGGNRNPLNRLALGVARRTLSKKGRPWRFLGMALSQSLGRQGLERTPELQATQDVEQYAHAASTKLAVAYAAGLEILHRVRPGPFGGAAVDLACGPGVFTRLLARDLRLDRMLGIDLSPQMIAAAGEADRVRFRTGDALALDLPSGELDLSCFTHAAHHLSRLEEVRRVLLEMDRVTRPDGVVFLMDLARLRTATLTERYVNTVGGDYASRGLGAFFQDFRNSMYAAWTPAELRRAIPQVSGRVWCHLVPRALPATQIILGLPAIRSRLFLRSAPPGEPPVPREMRPEWRMLRLSLLTASRRWIGARR